VAPPGEWVKQSPTWQTDLRYRVIDRNSMHFMRPKRTKTKIICSIVTSIILDKYSRPVSTTLHAWPKSISYSGIPSIILRENSASMEHDGWKSLAKEWPLNRCLHEGQQTPFATAHKRQNKTFWLVIYSDSLNLLPLTRVTVQWNMVLHAHCRIELLCGMVYKKFKKRKLKQKILKTTSKS